MKFQHRILALLLCVPVVQVGAGIAVAHHCCEMEVHHVHAESEAACTPACEAGHNPVGCCRSAEARVLLFQGEVLRTVFDRYASPFLISVSPFAFVDDGWAETAENVTSLTDVALFRDVGERLALFCVLRL